MFFPVVQVKMQPFEKMVLWYVQVSNVIKIVFFRKTKAVRKKRKSRRETETNEDAQTLQATSTELRREQEERKDISGKMVVHFGFLDFGCS